MLAAPSGDGTRRWKVTCCKSAVIVDTERYAGCRVTCGLLWGGCKNSVLYFTSMQALGMYLSSRLSVLQGELIVLIVTAPVLVRRKTCGRTGRAAGGHGTAQEAHRSNRTVTAVNAELVARQEGTVSRGANASRNSAAQARPPASGLSGTGCAETAIDTP